MGETIIVQWPAELREAWFQESIPALYDTVSCKVPLKLSLENCLSIFIMAEKLGPENSW